MCVALAVTVAERCCSTTAAPYGAVVVVGVTCYFVSDELSRFHLADAAEEAAQLVLAHALRQVVDDQVGPRLVVLHQLLRKAVIVQILVGRGGRGSVGRRCTGSQTGVLSQGVHPLKAQHCSQDTTTPRTPLLLAQTCIPECFACCCCCTHLKIINNMKMIMTGFTHCFCRHSKHFNIEPNIWLHHMHTDDAKLHM